MTGSRDRRRDPDEILADLVEAEHRGTPVRLHLRDGEVVVARLLFVDQRELVYAALRSSRPERYATCDSTGVRVELAEIERAQLLRDPA